MLANYKETLQLVSSLLRSVDDIQAYCLKHRINYQIAINIKNIKTEKPYPNQLAKILKSFGYNVAIKKEIMFTFALENNKKVKEKKSTK